MKVEFLKDPNATEFEETENYDRIKLIIAWVTLSAIITIFVNSRRPARVRVASAKIS
jgi:hypothetical protein